MKAMTPRPLAPRPPGRPLRPLLLAAALAALAGCSQFPAVDAFAASRASGPPPVLLPIDQVLAADSAPTQAAAAGETLAARAARLKARAAAMRGPG